MLKQSIIVAALFTISTIASHAHNCYYQDGYRFVPWGFNELSEHECAWKVIGTSLQKAGTCKNKEICQMNNGEPMKLNNTNPYQCGSDHCCYIKQDLCTGSSLNGNQQRATGSCVLPRYCASAVATDSKGSCSSNGYNEQLSCCVEPEQESTGVLCSKRYTSSFRRIDRVLDYFGDITSERITNFLPFVMETFDQLRESCLPRGDCSAATYMAFAYQLLRDFTTIQPDLVYDQIAQTVPEMTKVKIEKLFFGNTGFEGQMTPEAFGKFTSLLWHDKDLNLAQYTSGTCADWIRLSAAVRGVENAWQCDDRWAKIHGFFLCRPTSETNLGDCFGRDGACYLTGNQCPSDLEVLTEGNSECQNNYGLNAICCEKPKPTSTKMDFTHNEYRNVRVAIDSKIPNDPELLETIKNQFTKASAMLYEATGLRAIFRSVRIILPRKWDPTLANHKKTEEKPNKAEFQIKPNPKYGNLDRPTIHTHQIGFCGARGFGTEMAIKDLETRMAAQNIVKHFSFNRYGIFREFPRDEREMNPMHG